MPQGRHFAVTWSIPDGFGGMTAAMLARSAAFRRLGGVPVDVLTFDLRVDTPDLERRLRDGGALVDGVRLVNLYDWLRERPLPGGSVKPSRDVFTPLGEGAAATGVSEVRRGDAVLARIRRDDEGRVLQVDHLRDDGTLVLSDRRDTRTRGVVGGRSIVLCDADGRPVRSWRRIWSLYAAWLDALTDGLPSFMIVDSKTIAPFMLTYRRRHVTTAHVVHASHRPGPGDAHPIRRSRRDVFEHLEDFDLVALLTRRQHDDVAMLVGRRPNVAVIPNAVPVPDAAGPAGGGGASHRTRDADRGVMLAALTSRKRVSHAIDAMLRARASAGGGSLRLDVYGDGEQRASLERRIGDDPGVRLHGFDPAAHRELATASFLLLTSRSEGLPLVLVEAMAAGCLPIAYDIRYGPSDLIRDGRNGFLVRAGDIDGLAAVIHRLHRMPPRRVAAMRRRAMGTARRFDEQRITELWARELGRAAVRKALRRSPHLRRLRETTADAPLVAAARAFAVRVVAGIGRVRRPVDRVGH